ncbi:uncharacterized protein LOC141967306 [Athene noctua]|uniref:uncharacterized protein LOC141967306 n=1 Tax=Athene noctua TaxID=126797 RepID=UPI003EB8998D
MADGDEPPRCALAPAGTSGPGTQGPWNPKEGGRGGPFGAPALVEAPAQPCRPVPRVHAFGKGGQALRRDPRTPPALRGWLHKQDSSGLRLWKRRWFVLVDLCLYYYRDSSEQRVRGGLPLPGYEIRVLPPAPRAPQYLFTAEHPGMRTYCLGAETPEELNAWVCALRQGASPLPSSPHSLSLQMPQESRSASSPSPPLPTHPPDWCSLRPPSEELGGTPMPPPHRPPVPPLPSSKEEAPGRGRPCGAEDTQGGRWRGPPAGGAVPAAGRSPRELRPPGAETNQRPRPLAGRGLDAAEQDTEANQTVLSPDGSSDWLLAAEGSDGAPPSSGTASPPAANETSPWPRVGASGRGSEREGVAGRGARRPIRITLLQASF